MSAPHGTTMAALKGLAIASSFLAAGQLGSTSLNLPSLYPAADTSHRLAAQQFSHQYKTTKATAPPAELLTIAICSGLAYLGYKDGRKDWKLWAGAAGAMFSVIPWTIILMEAPSQKLLWVGEVADSATTPAPLQSSGIGVQVTDATAGRLGLPTKGHRRLGSITPVEEFEPFEDAIVGDEYEQLKVKKLLKQFNSLNVLRTLMPLTAGVLGLWAVLGE